MKCPKCGSIVKKAEENLEENNTQERALDLVEEIQMNLDTLKYKIKRGESFEDYLCSSIADNAKMLKDIFYQF